MKTTDLMIGDWVLISVWDCNPFPSKITSINYNSYQGKDFVDWIDTEDEEEIGMYAVQPISLTPEILEKNGFELSPEHARYYFEEEGEKYEFVLRKMYYINNPKVQKGWAFYAFNVLTLVDYVHELQHAFKLCGIEKEIVL